MYSIVKRERFPLPDASPLTEAELLELLGILAIEEKKSMASRARDRLIQQGDPVLPFLWENYETFEEIGRKNIIRVAGGIGSHQAIVFLIERFDDPDWERADDALKQLLCIMQEANEIVIQSYHNRVSAGESVFWHLSLLGQTGDAAFLPILSKACLDPAQCRSAAFALKRNGSDEALTILAKIADTAESKEVRKYAVKELKALRRNRGER